MTISKILFGVVIVIVIMILASGCLRQERFIFHPNKLPSNYQFNFLQSFEEINLLVEKDVSLNSVLLKNKDSKGVVFFLHGNGGSIDGWALGADVYLNAGYDILYLDYRGYGKSGGKIECEKQLISDAQFVYDYLKNRYAENKIIVCGTSIGTGIAAKIASQNNPSGLILNSPYYSLKSLIKEIVPIIPGFIIKYKLETFKNLETVKCPVIILHGDKDEVIPIHHALDLKKKFDTIQLKVINGFTHNDLSYSPDFRSHVLEFLK